MKQTCLVNAKEDEKGIAGQARNDRPFRMKQNKLIRLNAGCRTLFAACVCVCFCMYFSCNDSENSGHGTPYDPNKPVVIETFSPDSGGMATKLFITGHNFGNDPAAIKVYYNDKLAPVVGADGEHIYAITPRQPGELSDISVVVGTDSVIANKKFLYRTKTTVTTVAGKKGTTTLQDGTLAEATFDHPYFLCLDAENNLFMSHWSIPFAAVMLNEEKNLVQTLSTGTKLGAPSPDANGKEIVIPWDGGEGYQSFDPENQWALKTRLILHPSAEDIANGMTDFSMDWRQAYAICPLDKQVYTLCYNGQLVKFNPITKIGQMVADDIMYHRGGVLVFDPYHPNLLYISTAEFHAIHVFDVNTNQISLFAGTTFPGYKDGPRLEAEVNLPYQIVFDQDGSLVFTDAGNHCIRRIGTDGVVSTVIGKPGVAGYQDGNPDDALFNRPTGLAITKDYDIYVADYNNNCIRKLSVQ